MNLIDAMMGRSPAFVEVSLRAARSVNDTVGKKVKGWSGPSRVNGQFVLVFADGTYLTFGAASLFHDEIDAVLVDSLDLLVFGDDALVHAGVLSQLQMNEIRAVYKAIQDESAKAVRQKEYESLKSEFGGSQPIDSPSQDCSHPCA